VGDGRWKQGRERGAHHAWLRPDRFRRAFTSLGSFVQIPGGNPYPDLIEREPPKPLNDGHDLHGTRAGLPDALRWLWRS
jgi:hypothetical protein